MKSRDDVGCLGVLVVMLVLAIVSATIGAFCWPYSLNTWLVYCGKTAKVLWWHGALMGLIPGVGYLSIPVAILTWIVMLFLV